MTIVLKDGRTLHRFIAHAIGSIEVPMTDKQLEGKFAGLADGVIPASAIRSVMDACWNVESLTNAGEVAKMSQTVRKLPEFGVKQREERAVRESERLGLIDRLPRPKVPRTPVRADRAA